MNTRLNPGIITEQIRRYYVKGDERTGTAVYVENRAQYRGEGPVLWAVTAMFQRCLSRTGHWRDEPQPSSRSEAFVKRHRWTSFYDALVAAEKAELPE